MTTPFEDVHFLPEHPATPAADHEVLMSFNNDDGALMFRDWWELWGKNLFGAYAAAAQSGTGPCREEMYEALKARSEELQGRWYADERTSVSRYCR